MGLLLLWNSSVQGTRTSDLPDVYLEWSPTTGPSATPVWERIPLSKIRSIETNRGRNRELDQFQAGRMTVVLDNRDRTFDPQVSSNVKPMRRIRLRAVWDTTYDLFSGFVDSWDQEYEMTNEAVARVTATDGFKVWADAEMLSSAYAEEVQVDQPAAWWRLNEGTGNTQLFDASGNGHTLTVNGTPTFSATSLNGFDSDTAITLNANTDGADTTVPIVTNAPLTVEMIITPSAHTSSNSFLMGQAEADQGPGYAMQTAIGDEFAFVVSSAAGVVATVGTNVSFTPGETYHLVGVWQSDGTAKIFLDGVDVTDSVGGAVPGDDFAGAFAIGSGQFGQVITQANVGTYDEVAVYDYALSTTRITAHYNALNAPWNGDTTGARQVRIADAIEWPDDERDIDTGESTLQSAELGASALDHAQRVRDVEFGEFFFTPDGKVRFIARHNKWLPPYNEPLFILSDDGSDLAYGRLKFNFDDQLIRNRVTIGYNDGLVFTANSTDSQGDFLIRSYSKTGLIGDTDSEAVDYATYILNQYKDPLLRVQGVTITPQRDPDVYFPKVLAADLVYQVNVERTPQGTGSAIDLDYTIEGVSHHIEPKFWRTELQLSPADTPGAFILDSTSQGILDTNALGW